MSAHCGDDWPKIRKWSLWSHFRSMDKVTLGQLTKTRPEAGSRPLRWPRVTIGDMMKLRTNRAGYRMSRDRCSLGEMAESASIWRPEEAAIRARATATSQDDRANPVWRRPMQGLVRYRQQPSRPLRVAAGQELPGLLLESLQWPVPPRRTFLGQRGPSPSSCEPDAPTR